MTADALELRPARRGGSAGDIRPERGTSDAPGGLRPAGIGRRAAAFAIDAGVAVFLALPALLMTAPLWGVLPEPGGLASVADRIGVLGRALVIVSASMIVAFAVIQVVLHGLVGLTAGKQAMGLRSVNAVTLGRPVLWRVVLRDLALLAGGVLVPVLGAAALLASPLWDRGRGWPDALGGIRCLDVRAGASRAVPARPALTLVFDDGTLYGIAGDGLIGRNPQPGPGETPTTLLAVEDASWSISKTHAAFGMDDRGFWIADRGSRNGTGVRSASGERISAADRRVYVRPGDTVILGRREFVLVHGGQEER